MNVILIAVIVLGSIGLVAALILFLAGKKFAVHEDERIGQVQEVLPGANCGGCGFPGCGGFAGACVKAADKGSLEGLLCPVGGQPVMEQVADILGMKAEAAAPKVAVVRCNGTCESRPRIAEFDGAQSCKVQQMLGSGETACAFGCLGCGDCVVACQFDAIRMNPETGLPEVDEEKCTACGACSKACPRGVIEIRLKGLKNRRVVVLCNNKDKGAQTRKACSVGCIATSMPRSASSAASARMNVRRTPSTPSTSRQGSRRLRPLQKRNLLQSSLLHPQQRSLQQRKLLCPSLRRGMLNPLKNKKKHEDI